MIGSLAHEVLVKGVYTDLRRFGDLFDAEDNAHALLQKGEDQRREMCASCGAPGNRLSRHGLDMIGNRLRRVNRNEAIATYVGNATVPFAADAELLWLDQEKCSLKHDAAFLAASTGRARQRRPAIKSRSGAHTRSRAG